MTIHWFTYSVSNWFERRRRKKTIRSKLIERITRLKHQAKRFAENGFCTGAYAPMDIHFASLGRRAEDYYGLTETNLTILVWSLMELIGSRRKRILTDVWMSYVTLGYDQIRHGLESDAVTALYKIAKEPRPTKPTKVLESYWNAFIRLTR